MLAHPQAPAGGARRRRGRRDRWRATSWRSAEVDRGRVGGRLNRTTLASTCWVSAPCGGCAVATADLSDNRRDGWPVRRRQLVASIDRSHKKRNRQRIRWPMPGKALGVVQRWRCVNEPTEPGYESAADRCPTVLAQLAGGAAVTHGKARLQDRLHLPGPETVRMIFLQFLASSEQVIQTGLVQRGSVAAIRHPPVAHEHPGEVGPQNRGGIVEPAAGANGVDRRLRGDEGPQPVADGTDAPPGFIRCDRGRVADLLAQRRVGRRGVAGRAVQQVGEAARCHM